MSYYNRIVGTCIIFSIVIKFIIRSPFQKFLGSSEDLCGTSTLQASYYNLWNMKQMCSVQHNNHTRPLFIPNSNSSISSPSIVALWFWPMVVAKSSFEPVDLRCERSISTFNTKTRDVKNNLQLNEQNYILQTKGSVSGMKINTTVQ